MTESLAKEIAGTVLLNSINSFNRIVGILPISTVRYTEIYIYSILG